ncbi:hypothetical protein B2M26_05065 [Ferroacidibacillus organovorans]|uniref:NodB homology domain-containing protein n=1 Tax=Ferroacidibacillus organovorans TaxID=1765683 RepID=A0A1V4EVE1_9BACL|nr:hypothetical protein B2M26_05065 [Ferroacidibacillus organovorans]
MRCTFLHDVYLAIAIFLALWVLYAPLAELLFHVLHITSIHRGDELKRDVTLTFDDGPDPEYTPQMLDLLDAHRVRAVFFLIGEKATRYPELVREILRRGHLVGSHTAHHRNAWFLTPWQTFREVRMAAAMIERVTHEPVVWFRPPWGRFNLFLPLALRSSGQTPVLWSIAGRDWLKGLQISAIAERIAKRFHNGAVILLHDSGGAPGAPANTLRALEQILPVYREMGFQFTADPVLYAMKAKTKRNGSFPRVSQRLIHPLWRVWEKLFDRLYSVYPMSRMFRLSLVSWRLGPRPEAGLIDGVKVVEIHLQNLAVQELQRVKPVERMAIRGLREVRDSLHDVALALLYDKRFQEGQAIFGMTMIHRGMENLGFHVEDIPDTLLNRWIKFLLSLIMSLYHPEGRKRFTHGLEAMHPRLMWMSREELITRYGPGAAKSLRATQQAMAEVATSQPPDMEP